MRHRRTYKPGHTFIPPGATTEALTLSKLEAFDILPRGTIQRAIGTGDCREFFGYLKGETDSVKDVCFIPLEDLVVCWPETTKEFLAYRDSPQFISWVRLPDVTPKQILDSVDQCFAPKYKTQMQCDPMDALELVVKAEKKWKGVCDDTTQADYMPGSVVSAISRRNLSSIGVPMSTIRWNERVGHLASFYVGTTDPVAVSPDLWICSQDAITRFGKRTEVASLSSHKIVVAPSRGCFNRSPGAMFGAITGSPMGHRIAVEHQAMRRYGSLKSIHSREPATNQGAQYEGTRN